MSAEEVRISREIHQANAASAAALIEPGDYYTDGNCVKSHATGETVFEGISHWDACAVMLAIPRKATS